MSQRRVHQKSERTAEEAERIRAARIQFEQERPTPDELSAQGHLFLPLGEVLDRRNLAIQLRDERKRQGMTLHELSDLTGIDEPALSRLETGKNANPTLDTLDRVASALGKVIACSLRDKTTARMSSGSLTPIPDDSPQALHSEKQ